jgi:hypothetical protein
MSAKPFSPVGSPQSVAYSATSVSLFGNTPASVYRSVVNDATVPCYVLFNGTAASATLFTKKLAAGEFWQFPLPLYTQQVNIIWDAAGSGAARTTEY